ncbi:Helix-hairpin-helix motif-containing protein [bacterium A37T11]|nr:Helix-hairpin-helix motif-containing protein [bacterium A37T11]
MDFKICFLIFGIFFGNVTVVLAQEENEELIEQLMDQMAADLGEDFDYSELAEKLSYFRKHPIDINLTNGDDLAELRFISPMLITNLLLYREESGPFKSLYELQAIDGFEESTIKYLMPFIKLSSLNGITELGDAGQTIPIRHDLIIRYGRNIQPQLGYIIPDTVNRSRYLGSPDRMFLRYRYQQNNHLQVSLNMKKDPGEQFFTGSQKRGFDFYSASISVKDIGALKQVVLGDYSLQFGQGLALWTGLSFGKGAMLSGLARQGQGLKPYTSANETLFLRGAATTVGFHHWSITPFVSLKKVDAHVELGPDSTAQVSTLSTSGYHRTPTEIANRESLNQYLYGLNVQYKNRNLTIGSTLFQTHFDHIFAPHEELYRKYAFTGDQLNNANIYFQYGIRNVYIFGEGARSFNGGLAVVGGSMITLTHHLSLALLYRDYGKNYQAFYNQAIAEGSEAANEKGFYSGLTFQPSRRLEWTFYTDVFKFPWLRYRVEAPSQGYEAFSQATYAPNKRTKIILRWRYRHKEENSSEDLTEKMLANVIYTQYRAEGQYEVNQVFTIRTRTELIHYSKEKEEPEIGYMMYQDILVKPPRLPLSGNIRLAYFNTDGYNSRIYAFENDVLYGYSFPLYQNQGLRYYANLRYRMGRKMDVWLRYACYKYFEQQEIGSGLDLIEGSIKSDFKVQWRYQF